jgi:hypothetical protein
MLGIRTKIEIWHFPADDLKRAIQQVHADLAEMDIITSFQFPRIKLLSNREELIQLSFCMNEQKRSVRVLAFLFHTKPVQNPRFTRSSHFLTRNVINWAFLCPWSRKLLIFIICYNSLHLLTWSQQVAFSTFSQQRAIVNKLCNNPAFTSFYSK